MATQELGTEMEAVRIIPKSGCTKHRPEGSEQSGTAVPDDWTHICAHRYCVRLDASSIRYASAEEVVRHAIGASDRPALIIVHMTHRLNLEGAIETVKRQANIIQAAIAKTIPIFVTQRTSGLAGGSAIHELPDTLKQATRDHQQLRYFAGVPGAPL